MLSVQTENRVEALQQRLHDAGVVDISFFKKYPEYTLLTANQRANELCEVIEAMLDGRFKLAAPLGDSVRSPNMPSPVARCGGGQTGDQHEEQQTSGTPSQ